MKRDNVNYVLVGLFVIAAVALLLIALALITGRRGASAYYRVKYHNVSGLRAGAPVYYEGFRIGQVGAIEPQRTAVGTRYLVILAVRKDWPIPVDAVARMQSSGLLADISIGIREGLSKQVLADGGELKGEESADLFSAVNDLAAELTALTRSEITPLVRTLSERVNSITKSIDRSTPEIVEQTQALLRRANDASDAINDLLKPHNRKAVTTILDDLQRLSGQLHTSKGVLDQTLNELAAIAKENRPGVRESVIDLQSILAALSSRIDAIVHHLDAASRNVDEFSREIRKNPNRLLLAPKADKLEENE